MTKIIAFLMLFGSIAHADRVGNGGGVWTCTEFNGTYRSATLVDLFEARQEFQLFIPAAGISQTPQEMYEARKNWLLLNVPWVTSELKPYFTRIEQNIVMVDAALTVVDDSLFRIKPLDSDCSGGRWDYTQFANFTSYGRVLVRRDLWENPVLPALDKAALLFHEAVYLYLREKKGDSNSLRAREITGLLFSNLPSSVVVNRINDILNLPTTAAPQATPSQWTCQLSNTYTSLTYIGVSVLKVEAEFEGYKECEALGYPSYCVSRGCEPIISLRDTFACTVKNSYNSRTFLGKGRNQMEARVKALQSCEKLGYPSYCKIASCGE